VLTDFQPLHYRDHAYDPRVLSAPLETMVVQATLEGSPPGSTPAGLAQVFLLDFEAVNRDRARRVHSVARDTTAHGRVCSCGLVMGERGDPLTTRGHLDTDTWQPTELVVVAHERSPGRERFAVTCHLCGWAAVAWSADSAHASGDEHACGADSRPAATTAKVRAHLRL
jgi:hypothetical protein